MGQVCVFFPDHPSSDPSPLKSYPSSSPTAPKDSLTYLPGPQPLQRHYLPPTPSLAKKMGLEPHVHSMAHLMPGLPQLSPSKCGWAHSCWPLGCSGIESFSLARTSWARCSFLGMWIKSRKINKQRKQTLSRCIAGRWCQAKATWDLKSQGSKN